eukprot:scaffold2.g7514.t1
MVRITEELLRRRAEHNEGMLASLREISLHEQGIERIELLNQLCRHLRVLHLQNNQLCRIEGLNRLKELEQLNLAVNNLTRVEGLAGCESLARLDLTLNFVGCCGLPSLASLVANEALRELHLAGNPCTQWPSCRPYVLGLLPQLTRLDGEEVTPAERAAAAAALPRLSAELAAAAEAELAALGGAEAAAALGLDCGDGDSPLLVDREHIPETGRSDEQGEMRRPWCPATRVLEHREHAAAVAAAEAARARGAVGADLGDAGGAGGAAARPPLARLPPLQEGEPLRQWNEGHWEFSLDESADGGAVVLEVDVGRYLDTSLIEADVQPTAVRLLIKGRLLQLLLPAEVRPDGATARRSRATGRLVLTMPKERPGEGGWDVSRARPARAAAGVLGAGGGGRRGRCRATTEPQQGMVSLVGQHGRGEAGMQRAAVCEAAADGEADEEDALPPL